MNKGFKAFLGLIVIGVIVYFLYPIIVPQPVAGQVTFSLDSYQNNPMDTYSGYILGRFKFSNNTGKPVYVVYNCTATGKNGEKYFSTAFTQYTLGMGEGYYEDEFLFPYDSRSTANYIKSYDSIEKVTFDGFTYSFDKPADN